MKKYIFSLMLVLSNAAYGIIITLPSQEILQERLEKKGFAHFDEKTKLSRNLSNLETDEPLDIVLRVEEACYDYASTIRRTFPEDQALIAIAQIQMDKPRLTEVILENDSTALEAVRQKVEEVRIQTEIMKQKALLKLLNPKI